jgi:hypothetical protein
MLLLAVDAQLFNYLVKHYYLDHIALWQPACHRTALASLPGGRQGRQAQRLPDKSGQAIHKGVVRH